VKVLLLGAGGKVGTALAPRLSEAGHEVTAVRNGDAWDPAGHDAAVDFTRPDAVRRNVERCLDAGVATVVGTTGLSADDLSAFDSLARERGVACFVAPNFAIGAVLMMELSQRVAAHMPDCEIIELHHNRKLDAPSGTARRTAELIRAAGGKVHEPIHSVRLPGLVAHQEVIFGGPGQTLTIRHDSLDRESFMPGVLLAVRRVSSLERSPTIGLEHLL
jgi:4-hydroxy-tetrahydrodipicolinate reductase